MRYRPLFKLTLIEISDSRFAICFSISHVIADGHTFYSLYAMLSAHHDGGSASASASASVSHERVRSLDIRRDLMFSKRLNDEMKGNETYDWIFHPFMMMRIIYNGVFGSTPAVLTQRIDTEWVDDVKRQYAASASASASSSSSSVPFISTNDVLTSACFRTFGSAVGVMAMNFRNRFTGLTDELAGNYEALIGYNAADFASPSLIRRSLPMYSRVHRQTPLPLALCRWSLPITVLSTWVTFYEEIQLPGCRHVYHVPYFDISAGLVFQDVCVLFRPRAGDIELLAITRTFKEGDVIPLRDAFRSCTAL